MHRACLLLMRVNPSEWWCRGVDSPRTGICVWDRGGAGKGRKDTECNRSSAICLVQFASGSPCRLGILVLEHAREINWHARSSSRCLEHTWQKSTVHCDRDDGWGMHGAPNFKLLQATAVECDMQAPNEFSSRSRLMRVLQASRQASKFCAANGHHDQRNDRNDFDADCLRFLRARKQQIAILRDFSCERWFPR